MSPDESSDLRCLNDTPGGQMVGSLVSVILDKLYGHMFISARMGKHMTCH